MKMFIFYGTFESINVELQDAAVFISLEIPLLNKDDNRL